MIFAVLAGVVYLYLRPDTSDARLNAGAASRFPEHTVTYMEANHLFLVHQSGDDFFALYDQSPWLQSVHPEGWEQCHVRWLPLPADVPAPSSGPPNGPGLPADLDRSAFATGTASDHGVFLENCDGWEFDVNGNHVFGASTALDRYPVHLAAGNVTIDTANKLHTKSAWPTVSAHSGQ